MADKGLTEGLSVVSITADGEIVLRKGIFGVMGLAVTLGLCVGSKVDGLAVGKTVLRKGFFRLMELGLGVKPEVCNAVVPFSDGGVVVQVIQDFTVGSLLGLIDGVAVIGFLLGDLVGIEVGVAVIGFSVGDLVGLEVIGFLVGLVVKVDGLAVGETVLIKGFFRLMVLGLGVKPEVCDAVVPLCDGCVLGDLVGLEVIGYLLGLVVGDTVVGLLLGLAVGEAVVGL